jgi:hypothetical protein
MIHNFSRSRVKKTIPWIVFSGREAKPGSRAGAERKR